MIGLLGYIRAQNNLTTFPIATVTVTCWKCLQLTMFKDYYKVLGVQRGAEIHEIKEAYKKLTFKYNTNNKKSYSSKENLLQLKEAYETLCDKDKREEYDDKLYVADFMACDLSAINPVNTDSPFFLKRVLDLHNKFTDDPDGEFASYSVISIKPERSSTVKYVYKKVNGRREKALTLSGTLPPIRVLPYRNPIGSLSAAVS